MRSEEIRSRGCGPPIRLLDLPSVCLKSAPYVLGVAPRRSISMWEAYVAHLQPISKWPRNVRTPLSGGVAPTGAR